METKILSIFTRTPLHVGCGSSVGAVDQPVARERHTGYPVIPGSALKGVLADLWLERKDYTDKDGIAKFKYLRTAEGIALLGNDPEDKKAEAKAGSLLIGEGKLLAFPVRSAKGCWAFLTCPLAVERFARDTGKEIAKPEVADDKVLAAAKLRLGNNVIFEEYPLDVAGDLPEDVKTAFAKVSDDPVWKDNLADHLAIVSDDLFAYFVKNACEIANHNRIDDVTGVVADGALFSQENVPSEAMFYSVFNSRYAADFVKVEARLKMENNLLQIGADMTTGLGWCSVAMKEVVKKDVQ